MDLALIRDILTVCKRLDQKGVVNAYEGNVSVKRDGLLYITPAGKNKAFLSDEMICVLEEDTLTQVGGIFPPSSEMLLHTGAYGMREDVKSVIHCHPTMLTAFSLCLKPVQTNAYPEVIGNFRHIPCAPYGRPGTPEIFDVAADLVKEYDIVLLGNHGVLCVGNDVFDCMNKVEAAESIAKVVFYAEQIGGVADLPESEVQMFLEKQAAITKARRQKG